MQFKLLAIEFTHSKCENVRYINNDIFLHIIFYCLIMRHGIVVTIVKRQISNEDKNCRDNFITTKKTKKTNSSICF